MLWPPRRQRPLLLAALLVLTLAACGDGSGSAETSGPAAPTGFTVSYGVKAYHFSWNASANATRYELFEAPDGAAGPMPEMHIGSALCGTSYIHSLAPQMLHERVNASYRLRACDASGCGALTAAWVPDLTKAIGYFKASNSGDHDGYGASVALSADGSTLAVGAPGEASDATGVNGNQDSTSRGGAGAVYVFALGTSWSQQAYIKAGTSAEGHFGASVALAGDGRTMAVGGWKDVHVFTGDRGGWNQQAHLEGSKMPPPAGTEYRIGFFGTSTAIAADGNTLAVNALFEPFRLGETGVYPTAFVFVRSNGAWSQRAQLEVAKQTDFWVSATLALSFDGQTLAMGAAGEDSQAADIQGDPSDNSSAASATSAYKPYASYGAVYLY